MDTYKLGRTTLNVTRLGLGLAALGRPGYINLDHAQDISNYDISAMEQHTHTVLDAAWKKGIRYFDAARSYGRAEQFLASWLAAREILPTQVTVGSKWGYTYTAGWNVDAEVHEVKDHSVAVLRRQWTESRDNLGEYLKLYQIHSATIDSGVMDNHAVLIELAGLKAQGIAIGLSLSGANQAETLKRALDIRIDGARLFDAVQITYNVLEPSTGDVLAQAHNDRLGVLVKEAVANGRLTSRNTDPSFKPKRAILEAQAERLNTTIDGLALAAVLAQPWADVVLSGASTIAQLESNVKAAEVPWDDEAATAIAELAETPEVYWETRSNLPWN